MVEINIAGTVLSTIFSLIMLSTDIGIDNSFKAYMDYRYITSPNSIQYELQQNAWTDNNGFRRCGNNRYMVALGTYYTGYSCGKEFKIILQDDTVIDCITGDVKADIHTDDTNRYTLINSELACIVEFIVDTDSLINGCKNSGDCSYLFPGQIKQIVREDIEIS